MAFRKRLYVIITKEGIYMINLEPTSPGEILQEEFLEPMNITADTAMRFAMYFLELLHSFG